MDEDGFPTGVGAAVKTRAAETQGMQHGARPGRSSTDGVG